MRLEKFVNEMFGELDVLQEGDKFWFPAIRCASILGYANPRDAISRHCKGDGVVKRDGVSLTTNQHGVTTVQNVERKYISEGNLYRLIVHSKLPAAEKFEAWVFNEVLVSMREHNFYIDGQECLSKEDLEAVLKKGREALQLCEELTAKNKVLKQKNTRLSALLDEKNQRIWQLEDTVVTAKEDIRRRIDEMDPEDLLAAGYYR